MLVDSVTFVSFDGLSVNVGCTLASGTEKKMQRPCSCDVCQSYTYMDAQTVFLISANMDIHSKCFF